MKIIENQSKSMKNLGPGRPLPREPLKPCCNLFIKVVVDSIVPNCFFDRFERNTLSRGLRLVLPGGGSPGERPSSSEPQSSIEVPQSRCSKPQTTLVTKVAKRGSSIGVLPKRAPEAIHCHQTSHETATILYRGAAKWL